MISGGRPETVLSKYGFTQIQEWPSGCFQRCEDAREREVALKHLLAFRFETPKDGSDEDREYLMNTEEIYATWLKRTQDEARGKALDEGKRQGLDEGRRQGLRRNICAVYEARLGPMPEALRTVVDATDDMGRLEAWGILVAIGSAGEIAVALSGGAARG